MKRSLLFLIALISQSLLASAPKYIEEWEYKNKDFKLIRDLWGQGSYLDPQFQKNINKDEVKFVLEIGSRDVIDALDLSEFYKTHVCAFECNPLALDICKYNRNHNPNISIIPYAAWNETKPVKFYPVNPIGNRGASSLFKSDPDAPERYEQTEIEVRAIRLDEWLENQGYETPDLVCIDAQGATLQILQGLGERLSEVKYIIAEIEVRRYYEAEVLYPEVASFLRTKGFREVAQINNHNYFVDALFIQEN